MKTMMTVMAFLMSFSFSASASSEARVIGQMQAATARLVALKADPKRSNEPEILQETWDVLSDAAQSSAGERASDDFLHEFFTLTDTYNEVDDSGAAIEVFSSYYERKKARIDAYAKSDKRKTKFSVIERVLKAEKEYGDATDSPSQSSLPSPSTRVPSGTR